MEKEIERRQMMLQRISDVCRRIEVFIICLVGILIFLELFDIKIDFSCSHSLKLAVFILITGLFIVSGTLMVYLQTLKDGFTMGRLAWNLMIIWSSNIFVLCCTHNYIFGSSFLRILPTAVSTAFIIGGTQFMCYSLLMSYRRKQKINNDRQD